MNPTATTQPVKGMSVMTPKKISIPDYRSIQVTDPTFSPRLNCSIGRNGESKINLLDAAYYLSFCRSALDPINSQVITHDHNFFVLGSLYLNDMGDEEHIHCGVGRGTRKRFKHNQKEYKRLL